MVQLDCSAKCTKYILFAFNLIFVIAGLCLLGLAAGALTHSEVSGMLMKMSGSGFNFALIVLSIVGVVMLIVGFLGCCGAIKENHCMVLTYAFLIGLVLVIQLAIGIAGIAMTPTLKKMVAEKLQPTIKLYGEAGDEAITGYWNDVQIRLQCCGAQSYKDWAENTAYAGNKDVPNSCCTEEFMGDATCATGARDDPSKIYQQGCVAALEQWLSDHILVVAGIALAIAFIEIFGIICACCLARGIKEGYNTVA